MHAQYGVAVTSGTAALMCGLVGLGVGPGDEVIVPAYTWIASASAVVAVGAVPVVAEVDESLTLDPLDVERKITPYTRAIIPVHMRGAPCQMDALLEVARKHGLKVLEDTAQANGASFKGARLGSLGDAGAFSLQFNKIITSGEGGMLITSDAEVHSRVLMYQDVVGGLRNNLPPEEILPGINFRMPELLGAVARVQLRRLDNLLATMRHYKRTIKEGVGDIAQSKGVQFRRINDPEGDAAVAMVMLMPEAATALRVADALSAEGVDSGVMFSPDEVDYHVYYHWAPIMNQRSWTDGGGPWVNHPRKVIYTPDMCPRSLDLLSRAVQLDINPEMTSEQVEEVIEAIHKVLKQVT